MTREEREYAIDIIQSILDKYEEDECLVTEITIGDEDIEALKLAIKALEQEPILDKIFCIVHPLSIMSTPELEHKAIMQIAEMLEPLCLAESEE